MLYEITKEEFEKKYDNFLNKLFDKNSGHFHKLVTNKDKKEFGIFRNQNSVYVKAITDKETEMSISKEQLRNVVINHKEYLYSSYEPVLLDYIINDKLNDLSEVCEYYNYYKTNEEINDEKKGVINNNFIQTKNIILYGAPGVGKTHNYQKIISMIEEGESQKKIFDSISKNDKINLDGKIYKTIKDEKRVEFVTFHQSYSYEDFIEGFRPQENNGIELEDGVFKQVVYNAIFEQIEFTKENIKKLDFEDAFENLIFDYEENNLSSLESKSGFKANIIKVRKSRKSTTISLQPIGSFRKYIVSKNRLKKLFDSFNTVEKLNNIKNIDNEVRNIIGGCNTSLYWAVLYHILNNMEIIEEDEYNYNDLDYVEKTKLVKDYLYNNRDMKLKEKSKNFYIVIDEINRGNISKIFGELITLIEEDKRDTYRVTLPYSKESFNVPSNLYIIATMNSTDKSIATVDIALRRRFTFLKMKPNLALVDYDDARELMERLNKYIVNNLNEDFQLGHSYFMKIKNNEDLEFVKEYKIKPLLEEYFYVEEKTADEILKEIENI